jgi:HK97 gp10 family phage protein
MAQRFRIEGCKELERRLAALPKAMSRTVLRNALKKASAPMKAEAQGLAPTGLAESVVISTKLSKNQRRRRKADKATVEVFTGSKDPQAHLFEWGTAERRWRKGKSTGRMTPQPFMRPAWDATKKQAKDILFKEILLQLSKAVARLAKRAEKGTLSKRAIKELQG